MGVDEFRVEEMGVDIMDSIRSENIHSDVLTRA